MYGFTDANHDGFPDGLTFPTAGDGNFDIEVTVTTTRSALLSWGEGTSKGIVLPPCDGQVVRVRLEKAEETNIRLVCGLPNDARTVSGKPGIPLAGRPGATSRPRATGFNSATGRSSTSTAGEPCPSGARWFPSRRGAGVPILQTQFRSG